ncbi:ferritin-like domain-containing protein [Comamonas sp. GB3 AK4-5]|uniref:ferritin-like domain-containing protein n=1 Tax=Comamonas sp. GB3 AK4-5 TaxID=3231487 RepID=UPI00351F4D1C
MHLLSSSTDRDAATAHAHWRVEALGFERIDRALIADDQDLFYLLVSASFVETGSDTYAANLAVHYADHPGISAWLRERWEGEELQHGRALRAYVEAVWPAFPWQQAYDSFFAEYAPLCTVEELQADQRLEMVARCVVETGTAAYYHTLRELSREPVLRQLLGHIRSDEVGHYKHFLQYFKLLQAERPVGRARIAGALYARLQELRDSDGDIALRHVWAHRGGYFSEDGRDFAAVTQRLYGRVRRELPTEMAVRMLLKPLLLPHRLEAVLRSPIARLATWLALRPATGHN